MVVPLGPGKFYGSSLPRPRIYTDLKFSESRVDPPVPVTDSLLCWASEAHWSMGGLSHKRLRLQGRIEGSVSKLRRNSSDLSPGNISDPIAEQKEEEEEEEEEAENLEIEIEIERRGRARRRRLVKKLDDDFERVASEISRDEDEKDDDDVAEDEIVNKVKFRGGKTSRKKSLKDGVESGAVSHRTSPRLRSK